jgi:hypothetical protein
MAGEFVLFLVLKENYILLWHLPPSVAKVGLRIIRKFKGFSQPALYF